MKHAYWWVIPVVCLIMMCGGCQHRHPHTFFGRHASQEEDSLVIKDILARQKKAYDAENDVLAFVKADSTHRWVQHDFGWWYRYIHMSDAHDEYMIFTPVDTCCQIHETVYDLHDRFIVDAIRAFDTYRPPERDDSISEPFAYRFMLYDMVEGDTVMMLVPWYLAYGPKGNTYLPPYTNIRVLFTIHTDTPHDAIPVDETMNVQADTTNTDRL